MDHDFYLVLGVSRDADLQQIKRAYRRLVKAYHPDAAACVRAAESEPERRPEEGTETFLLVRQAYETLADQATRAQYDQLVRGADGRSPARGSDRTATARRRPETPAEPLREERDGLFSELDDFFAGWVPGLFTRGREASRHKDLYVELVLSPEEAAAGGRVPLRLPVEQACAECQGSGYAGSLTCPACAGRGRDLRYEEIGVAVPAGVADGTEARLSLADIGLPSVDLIVLVTVS